MALDNFIPQEWSARLLENLNDAHVYASVLNRDYEGEIKGAGDSVRIQTVGRITVSTYTKNSTTISRQSPVGAGQVLVIDQSNYFAFDIDDIDAAQAKPALMNGYAKEAAWSLSDTADADLASVLNTALVGTNLLTDKDLTAAAGNAYDVMVDLGVQLTKNNVPRAGRWLIGPPELEGYLLKDARFVGYGTQANMNYLTNGRIGRAAGFEIMISNNRPTGNGSNPMVIAGVKSAATYAEQISKTEAYRPEDDFSDALKGLHLYGRKVLDPTRLAGVEVTV